ncbi:ArsR family transcriptional regulator, partial [Aetokthonos hydrillicola CCALA 1050]|nr:ArsR family transcriptional regulator [Aetokthonos hydrillicola CCALA 1050]
MSKFLIDEYHLFYSPSLAAKVGRSAALILQRAYYWMGIKGGKIEKGVKWFYKTYEAWAAELSLSVSTARRAIASLKNQGLIKIEKLSADTCYHANWYTINFAEVEALFIDEQIDTTQNGQTE